jgi:hypothetical protein
MSINGEEFRNKFEVITNGIKFAIDFLKSNLKVEKISNLPFSTLIVPLTVYFAVPGTAEPVVPNEHRHRIVEWFWRSAFTRRYSSGVLRNLKADIEEMAKLRAGEDSNIGAFSAAVDAEFFLKTTFGIGNVNSKTFILLLAQNNPLTFISGQPIDLADKLKAANRAEFHHLMPRKFLKESGQTARKDSLLANFAFISRAENRDLGGKAPSQYISKMTGDVAKILERSIIPRNLFSDDYEAFLEERAAMLAATANSLCGNN